MLPPLAVSADAATFAAVAVAEVEDSRLASDCLVSLQIAEFKVQQRTWSGSRDICYIYGATHKPSVPSAVDTFALAGPAPGLDVVAHAHLVHPLLEASQPSKLLPG